MRRPKWIVFFDTFWTRDTPFETTIENGNEGGGKMEKKMEEFEERPSSRARREGQDLHHLTVVSRCLVCRWSLRGRWNNIAFSSSWHAGCNGRTAPRRRNCAPSRLVFAASRTAWRTAIPRPSRRTGTAIHDFVCVFVCFFFWFLVRFVFTADAWTGTGRAGTTIPTNDTEKRSHHKLDTMQFLSRARPFPRGECWTAWIVVMGGL